MFPWGKPTNFVQKINQNPGYRPKIHSLRKGKRWKKGMKIHFATGVRTKHYFQFKSGVCDDTQSIKMIKHPKGHYVIVIDGSKILSDDEKRQLSLNDGFDCYEDFIKWFENGEFPDQIIHWTEFRY
jgi:hypothetical protein